MIGISMVASAAGAAVTRSLGALGAGSEAIEGATAMARIARGARAVGSRVVGAEIEGTINAVGQVALHGGSFKEAMAENVLMSIGSGVIMSRLGKHLEFAEGISKKTDSLWARVGTGGALVLAKGLTIASHVIINAAVSYAAHQIMARGHAEPTSTELNEWLLQGAAIAIGRYVHGQIESRSALRQKLAVAHGFEQAQRLLADYDRMLRLAASTEKTPTDSNALELLGAHQAMVHEELALLEGALSDPAKARALALAEPVLKALHAKYGGELAALRSAGLAKLPLYHGGLEDVANGDAWRGTQRQIDDAIGHAKRSGMHVELTKDPRSGMQRAVIDGETFDLIVVSEKEAGASKTAHNDESAGASKVRATVKPAASHTHQAESADGAPGTGGDSPARPDHPGVEVHSHFLGVASADDFARYMSPDPSRPLSSEAMLRKMRDAVRADGDYQKHYKTTEAGDKIFDATGAGKGQRGGDAFENIKVIEEALARIEHLRQQPSTRELEQQVRQIADEAVDKALNARVPRCSGERDQGPRCDSCDQGRVRRGRRRAPISHARRGGWSLRTSVRRPSSVEAEKR